MGYIHITMELVKILPKHNVTLLYSLVIGLYKINIGSIKLVLYIMQFGASSENRVTTPVVWQNVLFLCILIKGIPLIPVKISLNIFSLEFTLKSETSINNLVLFALPAT